MQVESKTTESAITYLKNVLMTHGIPEKLIIDNILFDNKTVDLKLSHKTYLRTIQQPGKMLCRNQENAPENPC